MKKRILFCWIGKADLKATKSDDADSGPVAQALGDRDFTEVVLLTNWGQDDTENYKGWLHQKQTSITITCLHVQLSSPTNFGEIYQAASKAISDKIQTDGPMIDLVFHLSPGTPAMAAIWILLAKARFPAAELIESSKEAGVRIASIPFDISADFLPDLLKSSDRTLEQLAAGLPAITPEFDSIIHRSEVVRRVVLKARLIARRSIPVLIEGESGTGKELFARAIHDASPRKSKPFIVINCGAIPTALVESELFGHEKGAFTGANTTRDGHFQAANEGTIFLDEIGELPKEMQVKLLRAVQEKEVKRIGATTPQKVDFRIIAATNRNLIEEVAAGSFREDLFYRLAVAVIKLPPLRERTGDVSLLIDRLLEQINEEIANEPGLKCKKISAAAKNLLLQHSWPGNVRELRNTLTRATCCSLDDELGEQDIRDALLPIPAPSKDEETILNRPLIKGFSLPRILETVVVHYLRRGLADHHGNKTRVAEILGLPSYQTLTNWLKKYGLETSD